MVSTPSLPPPAPDGDIADDDPDAGDDAAGLDVDPELVLKAREETNQVWKNGVYENVKKYVCRTVP